MKNNVIRIGIKCNEKLYKEIKPILESFGYNKSHNLDAIYRWDLYSYLIIGYSGYQQYFGNIPYRNDFTLLSKEEFLKQAAAIMGKEYTLKSNKENIENKENKYPVIKCTQQLYNKIEDIIKNVGYELFKCLNFDNHSYLVVDFNNIFGYVRNVHDFFPNANTRYECSNIEEFLIAVCELKGFTVSYINNTEDNNFENHYFGYCINSDNKTIRIYENFENEVSNINPFVSEPNNTEKDNKNKESMEKINIAEKLKYCKKGTKLYHLAFGEVEFDNINDNYIIIITIDSNGNKDSITVTIYGTYDDDYPNGECLLFPSKNNRDWNNFQVLEKGHRVMVSDDCIDWRLREFIGEYYASPINGNGVNNWNFIVPVEDFDFTAEDISINKEKSII